MILEMCMVMMVVTSVTVFEIDVTPLADTVTKR